MDDVTEPPTLRTDEERATQDMDLETEGPRAVRYREVGHLGSGAMGEVSLCEDRRIGREVALKVASGHLREPSLRARFLQEARIQAQLEHPSIVPVYDIGRDEHGDPYFTMKRVRGLTLRRVLEALRTGDPSLSAQQYSRRRLLTAFATICLTVDYAHTREVLHRDLKPSNIMLGEYGEIYVLDWGVARSTSERDRLPTLLDATPSPEATAAGDIVGTPGYIAPEHVRSEAIDARADVYSLGAILFEILTLQRLHSHDASVAMIATLGGVDARPSTRAPDADIPPELDAICVKATSLHAADRYPSARALHDAVDRYLEGDRDLERRRDAAIEHTKQAQALAARAFAGAETSKETGGRTQAMVEVSRALAFDPTNIDARRVLFRLLTEPPKELPDEVKAELERHYEVQQQRAASGGTLLYSLFFFWAPLTLLFSHHRSTWFFALLAVVFAGAAVSLRRASKLPFAVTRGSYLTIAMTSFALSTLSGTVGPLVLVPSLVITNAIGFLLRPDRSRRKVVISLSLAAVAVPQLLEWVGLVPPSSYIVNGTAVFVNRVMDFTPATHVALFFLTLVLIVAVSAYFSRFRDMLTNAEERLYVHAWQLRQLLPRD